MSSFRDLTVVILASNETQSLRQTVVTITETCKPEDLYGIIIFLKSEDCASASEAKALQQDPGIAVRISTYVQKNKDLHRAFYEIPFLIESSHYVVMFADNATDAHSVCKMTEIAKQHPEAIVCASKWHKESKRFGYGFWRMICSRTMNRLAAVFIHSDGKDLFSPFQIYPMALIGKLEMTNPATFSYEYTLKPVARGETYIEIPTTYVKRTDSKSNAHFLYLAKTGFLFLLTAMRLGIKRFGKNR